jgi:hypothetical protein
MRHVRESLEVVVTELVRHLSEEEAVAFLLEHFPGAEVVDVPRETHGRRRAA